ncbi:hypothetical protein AAVH_27352, partial [Aphelenchoides avenae]
DLFDLSKLADQKGSSDKLLYLRQKNADAWKVWRAFRDKTSTDAREAGYEVLPWLGWNETTGLNGYHLSDISIDDCKTLVVKLLEAYCMNQRLAEAWLRTEELEHNMGDFNSVIYLSKEDTIQEMLERVNSLQSRIDELEDEAHKSSKHLEKLAADASRMVGTGQASTLNASLNPVRNLERSLKALKRKLDKTSDAALTKEREILQESLKKVTDENECMRKDGERQREEIERLTQQLNKMRLEKDGGNVGKTKKKK